MYKYAQILNNTVHAIIEDELDLDTIYSKKYNRNHIILIDITNADPQPELGWICVNGILSNSINPPPDPIAEKARIQKALTDAVQRHMDRAAQALGYDDLLSAVTYADEPAIPKFQAEGVSFREWRSNVWAFCYAKLADVEQNGGPIPTAQELISQLPPRIMP